MSNMNAGLSRPTLTPAEESLFISRGAHVQSALSRYLRMARRWKWVIAGATALGVATALILTLLMTQQYSATVSLEIAREEARIINVEDVQPKAIGADQEFYQTQYGLLESRALAERVTRELRLADNQQFLDLHGIKQSGGVLASEQPLDNSPAARAERLNAVTDLLLSNVDITPVRLSRIVYVTYTSPDPAMAARIANTWAELFIRSNIERRFEATAYARTFLEGRLQDLRQRLDQSERQLVSYAANQRIININTPTGDGAGAERPITADDLVVYNQALAEARAQRIAAESGMRQGGAAVSRNVNNPTVAAIRQRRSEIASELARLRAQFGPDYPQVQSLTAQLEQIERTLGAEETRVASTVAGDYRQALAREQALERRVEDLKNSLIDLRRRSIQYNILQREVDTNRALYDGLLQRYKEIGIAGGVGTNNVSIVDSARVPEAPSSPRPLLNLLLGIIAGLTLGAALAFALEQLDEAITDPSELETSLGIPSLGVVPKLTTEDPIQELQDRRSVLTEAYLTIKTNLQLATPHGVPRSLMITSTRAAEGKSTTALALAMVLARQDLKVVIVDSDMRSPSLHKRLGIANEAGLSNVLSGNASWEAVIQPSGIGSIQALSAGPHPPNAAELLSGPGTDELIKKLLDRFDHVIVDAPPMLGLADAPLIASKVGGVVYVVESFGVQSRSAKVALNRLLSSNTHMLGAVLTKFESKKASYGYGYDYGYGYGSEKAS